MKHLVSRYIEIWFAFFRNTLSRDMEFKINFIFEIFIDAVYYGSLFFFFQIIFQFTDSLGDFNKDAVIIFLITVYISDLIYVFFLGGNVFGINDKVKSGDLDFILLKPINSQFFVSCRYVMTNALISLFILTCLLIRLIYIYHGYQILFENFIFYLISIILGIIIFYSFEFMISCLSFWFRNFSFAGWLAGELIKYSRRPDSIYKKWFRKSLFTIFPMALISSVPSRMLLFGPDIKLLFIQFFIASCFLFLTTIVWNKGLQLYESASS